MNTIRLCSSCSKLLPPDAPAGLCPVCLLKTDFGTEPVAENASPPPAEIARHFPHLEILELIGRGGMGIVYKARQPKLDRLVALKILPIETAHDAAFAERFSREARALARLNHPNIVAVYDFGQSGAYYYFIMEFVDGMNLRQLIRAKTLEPRQALELVTQICTALQFAHDEKIVHRDIKPENILITKKGQVKIADFGLAKLLGSQPDTALTASQMVMGTMNYMAPEQRENSKDVDHRADIYSLGVVFYEMLTGEVPMGRFDAPSKKVQIDVRLDEVVLHALEREPARRYQQVSEVKSNVETITSTMPSFPPSASAPMPEAEKVFSRSDVISIAKFILALFICYVVGCFVPFVGLLMFCAVLLVGARQLSAQMKKASAPLPATPPPAASSRKKTVIFWLCAYGVLCLGWLVTKMLWNFGSPGCWLACFGMAALVMCVSGITVKRLRLFPAEFSLKKAMPIYLLPLAPIFLFLTLGFVFLIGGFFNQWEQGWWHGNLSAMTPQQFEAANKGKEYKLLWGLDAFVSNDVPIVEMNYGSVQRRQTGIADTSIPFLGAFPGWESHGPRQDPDISWLNLPNGFFLLVWGPICLICGWRGPGTKPFRAPRRNVLASLGVSACVLGSVLPIYVVCHLGDSYTSLGRSFRTKIKMDTVADTIQKWALQNGYAVGDEVEWDIQTVPRGNRVAKVSIREAWKPSPFDRWQATWTSFHRVSPYIAFELVSTENPDQTIVNVSSVKEIPEDLISVLDKIDQTNPSGK